MSRRFKNDHRVFVTLGVMLFGTLIKLLMVVPVFCGVLLSVTFSRVPYGVSFSVYIQSCLLEQRTNLQCTSP